jgi:hypothetical protein
VVGEDERVLRFLADEEWSVRVSVVGWLGGVGVGQNGIGRIKTSDQKDEKGTGGKMFEPRNKRRQPSATQEEGG